MVLIRLWGLHVLAADPELPEMQQFQHADPSKRGHPHSCPVGQFSHVEPTKSLMGYNAIQSAVNHRGRPAEGSCYLVDAEAYAPELDISRFLPLEEGNS